MSWSNNNIAHTSLWFFERWHHKREEAFTPSGEWESSFLIKSAAGESADMRREKAETHARLLDGVFTGVYSAGYEPGISQADALAAMVAVLTDTDNKLKDLGDPVDSCYQFVGEVA